MLQKIRDKLTGGFAMAILAIIFVPFAFFGLTNYNFLSAGWAAKVDDAEISLFQLENAYQNQLLQLSEYGELPAEYLTSIKSSILERLIRDTLVELHVAESGYAIDDGMVMEIIQGASQFQEDGVFKKELYYTWLDQTAQDARVFEAQQRQAMRNSQLQRGIGATAFVTPAEYRRYLNLVTEQRQVSIATFDVAALAETVIVKDEDVSAYYEARPNAFMSPETVDFEYIDLRRDWLMQTIEITEEELVQLYEETKDRYQQDEQRQVSHILITFDDDEAAAEEQATALAARANAGEPFEDLARQYSKDGGTSEQGGSLGTVLQSQFPGALGDAIFGIQKGEIQGPVKSDFGFHIIRVDDIIAGGALPFDQVRSELEADLKTRMVDLRFIELERALSDALFDANDLQMMAETSGLTVMQSTGYTRSGGEPYGANQAMIDTIFDEAVLVNGQISDVIEVDNNRSSVVQVTEYHPEARKTLDEVRDDITFTLQSERALNMIQDRARRFSEALQEGKEFDVAASEVEAAVTPAVIVGRQDEKIDAAVLDAVFRARKPSPGNARIDNAVTTGGDYAVFMLTAVIPGRPESIPLAERDARKDELESRAGNADYTAYVTELAHRASIERSEEALQQQDFFQ
jgi:peptidyl-prolyl cis-trans isomerase D